MEFFLKNWEPQMLKAQAFILQIISYCYSSSKAEEFPNQKFIVLWNLRVLNEH
jgi:hypothetical protein